MTREQARDIIIATAEIDEDGEDLEVHPVDADLIAHLDEDNFYAQAQASYLESLADHEREMLRISTEPEQHFHFELKRNGTLKRQPALDLAEFDSIPF